MSSLAAQIGAHARLLAAAAIGALAGAFFPGELVGLKRFVLGWDVFAATYLLTTFWVIRGADARERLQRALATDDGAVVMMIASIGSALASVAATLVLLSQVAEGPGAAAIGHYLALGMATVGLSWALVHTVFALHYAHVYELDRSERPDDPHAGGLSFPGTEAPGYLDFFYFSFVIGVAAQTADVAITSSRVRRLSLVQGVIAFWFNTAILAMALNAAATAFG